MGKQDLIKAIGELFVNSELSLDKVISQNPGLDDAEKNYLREKYETIEKWVQDAKIEYDASAKKRS